MVDITAFWTYFRFRNPHSIGPVVIQCFMLLSACLIILGLLYVFFLVVAMAIHHFLFDRDPKRVPDYVKKSIQFSSESEDSDSETKKRKDSADAEIKPILIKLKKSQGQYSENEYEDVPRNYAKEVKKPTISMAARRTNNLDKFMGKELDVQKTLP